MTSPYQLPLFLSQSKNPRKHTSDPGLPKPDVTNTGPRIGLTLSSGDKTLTSGQSASGLHITGDLYMGGPNTTATDCLVDGAIKFNSAPGGNYGNPNAWTNQVVSYCKASHIDSSGFDTITVDHCNIDGSTVQVNTLCALLKLNQAQNLTFTNNYLHDPAEWDGVNPADPHLEAFHLSGCTGATITNNWFNWNAQTNALTHTSTTVSIDNSGNSNITFDGNYLNSTGGPNQIILFLSGTSYVRNNKFTTPPSPNTQYSDANSVNFHFTQSGNTLDGAPYSLPYS